MTYNEIEKQRNMLAENTSSAYRRLRAWLDESVKRPCDEDVSSVMEHVYAAAKDLASCREEELRFLNDPVNYMTGE